MSPTTEKTHAFWRFFIDNYRITYLLILAVIVFGVVSIVRLPKESAPEVDIPVGVVTTTLPGAGAQNVEELVTDPIENQISGLTDVTSFTSTSEQGISTIIVQYDTDVDSQEKIADLRGRVDRAQAELPDDAGSPRVQQVSFSDQPIIRMALAGPFDPSELKPYAEALQDELETITNVSQVRITGAPDREISVTLNPSALSQYDLSSQQVIQALAQANTDVPIGAIETNNTVYTLRFDGRFTSAQNVRETAIAERGGSLVTVSDVASVEDAYADQNTLTRFSSNQSVPESTVSIQVFKQSGEGNILTITRQARAIAEELSDTEFPEGVTVEVLQSDAEVISSDLATLTTSGVFTVGIIVLVLALFLGWREAILASIVVPLSFLFAFIGIFLFSLTINFLTLFSLILSLGILVDAAIVVTESIFTKRAAGMSGVEASVKTIDEFQAPLVAGTMTTVFVFLPMLLTSGTIGEFIVSIPITVSIVLLSALFVALGVVTTLATRFLKTTHHNVGAGLFGVRHLITRLYYWYSQKLELILYSKRQGRLLLAGVVVAFAISVSFPFLGVVQINMFPAPDSDTLFIDIETPAGTPLGQTSQLTGQIESLLQQDEQIESFLTTIGQTSQAGSIDIASAANSNIASITLNLADDRRDTSAQIVEAYQQTFHTITEADVRINNPEGGPETGSPVQIRVVGDDLVAVEETARSFASILSSIEGTQNVESGISTTAGEFSINVDQSVAQRYGVSAAQIAGTLRAAVSGNTATDIKSGDEDINIVVSSEFSSEREAVGSVKAVDLSAIRALPIQTSRGNVSLATFAEITLTPGRESISHEDGERVVTVSSALEQGANASQVVSAFQRAIEDQELPDGVGVEYGGETEDIQESFTDLGQAMILGVFAIFALMVWQFKSYRQPLFILVTVPLALTGVFFGLALVRQPFSFPGFIGIVALSGVVVNNAIILIDAINNERIENSKEILQAVLDGARSRLQPVILTTITTVTGLIPLTLSDPTWAPVAYSIMFGLLFSTVLTLFVVPILYSRFADKKLDLEG